MATEARSGSGVVRVLADAAELTREISRAAKRIDLPSAIETADGALDVACRQGATNPLGVALVRGPTTESIVRFADHCRTRDVIGVLMIEGGDGENALTLASDAGVVATHDVDTFVAALALVRAPSRTPWTWTIDRLNDVDRSRLERAVTQPSKSRGRIAWESSDDGVIGWNSGTSRGSIGPAHAAARAVVALEAAEAAVPAPVPPTEGTVRSIGDVLFGPPRGLSDPASKTVLRAYGAPLPREELCASPSRAAAEAHRLGFPVRLSLASPDLRIWDHPGLSADGVDHAAEVRDVFRQLTTAGEAINPDARVLGVTVAASRPVRALLHATLRPLPSRRVELTIGFADPHGLASGDETSLLVSPEQSRFERALDRLQGITLLGEDDARAKTIAALHDLILRSASLVADEHAAIEYLRMEPIALVDEHAFEVREASVRVSDAFEKSMLAAEATARAG